MFVQGRNPTRFHVKLPNFVCQTPSFLMSWQCRKGEKKGPSNRVYSVLSRSGNRKVHEKILDNRRIEETTPSTMEWFNFPSRQREALFSLHYERHLSEQRNFKIYLTLEEPLPTFQPLLVQKILRSKISWLEFLILELLWKTNARHVKEKGKNFENLIVKKKLFPVIPRAFLNVKQGL